MKKRLRSRRRRSTKATSFVTGKTAGTKFSSPRLEKEYQIARLVYQANDSAEFRQLFINGKLSSAGRIFNAYNAKAIEEGYGKIDPLKYGEYRSEMAKRDISPDQINFKTLNLEEQKMLASIETEQQKNGGKNSFSLGTLGGAETVKRGYDGRSAAILGLENLIKKSAISLTF